MSHEIEATIQVLRAQIARLEAENARLHVIVNAYASNAEKNEAAKQYIARLVGGTEPPPRMGYNLKHSRSRATFQVQFSKVQEGNRWQWTGVVAADGLVRYDHLVLVGEARTAFAAEYKDRGSQYVLFDVPASEVRRLATPERAITANVNPVTAKTSAATLLFNRFQVTWRELQQRYDGMGS